MQNPFPTTPRLTRDMFRFHNGHPHEIHVDGVPLFNHPRYGFVPNPDGDMGQLRVRTMVRANCSKHVVHFLDKDLNLRKPYANARAIQLAMQR